jgi:hypothetical protein
MFNRYDFIGLDSSKYSNEREKASWGEGNPWMG